MVVVVKPSGVIYRLGRGRLGVGWTGRNARERFDDPDATYRGLYASSQRLGCFLETFARFGVDPKLAAELAAISGEDDHFPLGEVPVEWLQKRILGVATAGGQYADVCSSEWICSCVSHWPHISANLALRISTLRFCRRQLQNADAI
jgi:hypothetical protein